MEILTKMVMQHKGSNMKFNNLKLLLWTDESSLGVVLTLVSSFLRFKQGKKIHLQATPCVVGGFSWLLVSIAV